MSSTEDLAVTDQEIVVAAPPPAPTPSNASDMTDTSLYSAANALAGAGGGVLSLALTYPLFTIVTKLQVRSGYDGPLDAALSVLRAEGFKGFYAGISTALVGNAYAQGIYYYWYALFRSMAEGGRAKREVSTLMSLIVGALAGAVAVLFTNPFWVVTTRLQTQRETSKKDESKHPKQKKVTTLSVIKDVYGEFGLQGFWNGLIPSLMLVSNPAIQYMVFEQLKQFLFTKRKVKPGTLHLFLMGAIAKTVATVVTYPYITVKTRLQATNTAKYRGTLDVLKRVYSEEGLAGFYKGMGSKIIQTVLTASILMMTQDRLGRMIFALLLLFKRKVMAK